MGKKVRKYAKVQDFSKRREEEEAQKESPFSSIVLKEKREETQKKAVKNTGRRKASDVVQGYDPNASFADILSNFERTGNPYAMPKKKDAPSSPISFGDILDKWEGKDKKKSLQKEQKKSTYKATRSFADILSEYEGVPGKEVRRAVLDEEVSFSIEKEEEKKDESPLFKKESIDEARSPEASWSIYGNNESFVRKEEELSPPEQGIQEEKREKTSQKRSTYKATRDFGEILKGFYENHDELSSESIAREVESAEEALMEGSEPSFFKEESGKETRNPEASWSVYGRNDSFIRKEEKKTPLEEVPAKDAGNSHKKSGYKGKKEFAKILDSYDTKKKEKADVKTFEDIIKEKGDVPSKREYTVSQLRTMMPQATLDLHGKTQEEAEEAVSVFLKDCRAHKIRKISIITGKGLHSEGGVGVLRDVVSDLLEKDGGISEKSKAPLQYGGSGAFWVILKKED